MRHWAARKSRWTRPYGLVVGSANHSSVNSNRGTECPTPARDVVVILGPGAISDSSGRLRRLETVELSWEASWTTLKLVGQLLSAFGQHEQGGELQRLLFGIGIKVGLTKGGLKIGFLEPSQLAGRCLQHYCFV